MIGEIVLGIYKIRSQLGEGGMGAVYLATSETGHRIAIKTLHAAYARHPMMLARFQNEATNAARIHHPNVIEVMGQQMLSDGRPAIALEYLEGKNLGDYLHDRKMLTAEDALPIALQFCAGLHGTHIAGIVHRDFKPDNIYICSYPVRGQVKVLDFGISKFIRDPNGLVDGLTATGMLIGTPWYMAPEQAESPGTVTARADVFSAGVVLYEMLSGVRPYRSDNPTGDEGPLTFLNRYAKVGQGVVARPSLTADTARQGRPREDIPRVWIEEIERAISIDPARRQATIRELIEALWSSMPDGERLASVLTPSLIEVALDADATRREIRRDAVPLAIDSRPGSSTGGGLFTAPQARASSTTFHRASGQVEAPTRQRPRGLVAAVAGVVVIGGIVGAIWIGRSRDGGANGAPRPLPAAVGASDSSSGSAAVATAPVDAAIDATPTPIDAAAIDAAPVPVLPVDAGVDAAPPRPKHPPRGPRSPNAID